MFHVSTYIPYTSKDRQQVERKRFLGNDVVIIVFKDGSLLPFSSPHRSNIYVAISGTDGNDAFSPETFASHFNHVFLVVQPVPGTRPPQYKYIRLPYLQFFLSD